MPCVTDFETNALRQKEHKKDPKEITLDPTLEQVWNFRMRPLRAPYRRATWQGSVSGGSHGPLSLCSDGAKNIHLKYRITVNKKHFQLVWDGDRGPNPLSESLRATFQISDLLWNLERWIQHIWHIASAWLQGALGYQIRYYFCSKNTYIFSPKKG